MELEYNDIITGFVSAVSLLIPVISLLGQLKQTHYSLYINRSLKMCGRCTNGNINVLNVENVDYFNYSRDSIYNPLSFCALFQTG